LNSFPSNGGSNSFTGGDSAPNEPSFSDSDPQPIPFEPPIDITDDPYRTVGPKPSGKYLTYLPTYPPT